MNLLFTDGKRQLSDQFELGRNVNRPDSNGHKVVVPIIVRRHSHKEETWVTLSSPIAPDVRWTPFVRQPEPLVKV